MHNDKQIDKLVALTVDTIKRDSLSADEVRSINAREGWEVEGVGVYRLSMDKVDRAHLVATKYERNISREIDRAETLSQIGRELIHDQPWGTVAQVNNSREGFRLENRNHEREGAIRFSDEGLMKIWEAERSEKVHEELYKLSSDILYRELSASGSDFNEVLDRAETINHKTDWQVPGGGSYRLAEDTLDVAAWHTEHRLRGAARGEAYPNDARTDVERMKEIGVSMMEGKGLSLDEARGINTKGFRVKDVGVVRLDDQVLVESHKVAHEREKSPQKVRLEEKLATVSAAREEDWSR